MTALGWPSNHFIEDAEGSVADSIDEVIRLNSPLKKASLTGFHPTMKHNAAKAVSPSCETMTTT